MLLVIVAQIVLAQLGTNTTSISTPVHPGAAVGHERSGALRLVCGLVSAVLERDRGAARRAHAWSVAARTVGLASRAAHWLAAPSSRHSRRHRRNRRRRGRRRRRLHLLQHQRGQRAHPDRQRAVGGGLRKTLLQFEKVPQPRVVDVALNVDIYPNDGRVNTTGRYTLENRTASPSGNPRAVDARHVTWAARAAGAQLRKYAGFNYRIYALDSARPRRARRDALRHGPARRGSGTRATRPTSSATAPSSTTCWSRRSSGWDETGCCRIAPSAEVRPAAELLAEARGRRRACKSLSSPRQRLGHGGHHRVDRCRSAGHCLDIRYPRTSRTAVASSVIEPTRQSCTSSRSSRPPTR